MFFRCLFLFGWLLVLPRPAFAQTRIPNPPGWTFLGDYLNGLGNLTISNAEYHKGIQEARLMQQMAERARLENGLMKYYPYSFSQKCPCPACVKNAARQ